MTPPNYHGVMGPKAFKLALISIGGLLVLSAMPGTGVFIGLFFAFSIAFFIAPLAFGLQWMVGATGLPTSLDQFLRLMLVGYYALVAIGFFRAFLSFKKGNLGQARSISAKAALFAALPIAGYFSSDILAKAWR